ncbi:hypothetical protein RND81_07G003600 [Saponaria officinalis]|uniref:Calcineurin-like phosphoesterase domain-containing protein n=1 Tax=Saponaria officinalis TaxID=3572 RepID=A0AAW1GML2_SAPOF
MGISCLAGRILRIGKAGFVCAPNKLWFEHPFTSSPCRSFRSTMATSFRIVVVGDIHEDWDFEQDYKALKSLQPDLVLFTGDFGNENYELVRSVAKIDMPKAAILGNHDSWSTQKFSSKKKDGVQLQLEALGEEHVGYGRLDFPALKASVVGGRPFSCGGDNLFRKKLLKRFGVKTMEDSADKIHKAAMETPDGHSVIFLAHNGPAGLGSGPDDICGKDWEGGGDFGDADLAQAISLLKENSNYHVPLVVFGHMHKELLNGGFRKMISIGSDNTIYLNAAIIPRVKSSDLGKSRAFTVADFEDGKVTKVVETWVLVAEDETFKEEHILFDADIYVTQAAPLENPLIEPCLVGLSLSSET